MEERGRRGMKEGVEGKGNERWICGKGVGNQGGDEGVGGEVIG